jgi:hypothetical protein
LGGRIEVVVQTVGEPVALAGMAVVGVVQAVEQHGGAEQVLARDRRQRAGLGMDRTLIEILQSGSVLRINWPQLAQRVIGQVFFNVRLAQFGDLAQRIVSILARCYRAR